MWKVTLRLTLTVGSKLSVTFSKQSKIPDLLAVCAGRTPTESFFLSHWIPAIAQPTPIEDSKVLKTILYSCRGNTVHQELHLTTKFTLDLNLHVYSFDIKRGNTRWWNNDDPCWNTN